MQEILDAAKNPMHIQCPWVLSVSKNLEDITMAWLLSIIIHQQPYVLPWTSATSRRAKLTGAAMTADLNDLYKVIAAQSDIMDIIRH